MKRLIVLFVVIATIASSGDWHITFTRNELNVSISLLQQCWLNNKLVWKNVSVGQVEEDWTEVTMHRETAGIPKGAACNANFQVMRNPSGRDGDPNKDYEAQGESASITWTQKE